MTTQSFKKGDKVYLIRAWDRKGTVMIDPATVESWGKRQATLRLSTGNMAKEAFFINQIAKSANYSAHIISASDDANAYALDLAQKSIDEQRAHFENCLARSSGDAVYCAAIREKIAELHAPSVKVRES